jgi:MFS family permease
MIIAEDALGDGADEKIPITLRGWVIWGVAALFYLYEFFVRVAPSAMAPELQETFKLSAAGLGAAIGTYYIIYSPSQLLAGSFLDRFGAKNILVPASLVCSLGCFLEVLGHDAFLLSAARFCQGLGSAFAFVGTMYLAAEWFPRSTLALLSGLTTSLGMAGAIIGNSGIAHIVEKLGWHASIIAAGVLGLVITALIYFVVPHKGRHHLEHATTVQSVRRPGIFSALRIVYSNPQSWLVGISGTALYMPLSILGALWGVEYISSVTGGNKVAAAGAVSMLYVGWLIGGPIAGWFSDRTGMRRNLLLGAGVATFITTLVVVCIHSLSVKGAYVLMLLMGFASTSQVVCFATAVEHNPKSVSGTAIAATNMMIMFLGGAGEWMFGVLLDHFSGGGVHDSYPAQAYHKAILLLPAISAIGLVAAFFLTEPSRKKLVLPADAALRVESVVWPKISLSRWLHWLRRWYPGKKDNP